MQKQKPGVLLMITLLLLASGCTLKPSPADASLRAGLRSSHYGISPFPNTGWWVDSTGSMAARFDGSVPSVVWIVGVVGGSSCLLNFPISSPDEGSPNIISTSYLDKNEEYLTRFDQAGVQVWLQVEPASADVSTLVDLVLKRYSSHPSVVGFGVDVEWYENEDYHEGKAVTDAEARAWSEQVRSYNPEYQLFLKHWLSEKMPPTYREGMMFLDDSQIFESLDGMVGEFKTWGETFAPASVGFQYGYRSDKKWWGDFSDPPKEIGQALVNEVPNLADLYWVDFTAEEIWPQDQ